MGIVVEFHGHRLAVPTSFVSMPEECFDVLCYLILFPSVFPTQRDLSLDLWFGRAEAIEAAEVCGDVLILGMTTAWSHPGREPSGRNAMPSSTPTSVILYVSDVQASTEFYRTILGSDPVATYVGFAVFALCDTVTLGLQATDLIEPKAEAHVGGTELLFSDADRATVDRLYGEWTARNIPIALHPTELPFGYTFVALDPDGHRLRVCATDTTGLH